MRNIEKERLSNLVKYFFKAKIYTFSLTVCLFFVCNIKAVKQNKKPPKN